CDDGLDNDGDGEIDEGCEVIPPPPMGCTETGCPTGQRCDDGSQLCQPVVCDGDLDCPADSACVDGFCAESIDPGGEICHDGLDNDGDGQVDEGCDGDPGDCGPEGCPEGMVCEPATGVCLPAEPPAIRLRPAELDFGAVPPGEVAVAQVTVMNIGQQPLLFAGLSMDGSPAFTLQINAVDPITTPGVLADPDGDGQPGLAPQSQLELAVTFTPPDGQAHAATVIFTTNDPVRPQALLALQARAVPGGEICGDGVDNDGDGQVDEGCGDPNGQPCIADVDCPAGQACVNGLCDGGPVDPGADGCDGLDNDGDGFVDEDCDPNAGCLDAAGVPVPCACAVDADCPAGQACVNGQCGDGGPGDPGIDGCDGMDNDGDGLVDEDCDPNAGCFDAAGVPVPCACAANADCAAGQICVNGACQG
ncbi:MAG: hypothetical protein KC613_11910, partial [Myxococcales bacterium]|nr:hypothetical protein [Myxococcales bacterium]